MATKINKKNPQSTPPILEKEITPETDTPTPPSSLNKKLTVKTAAKKKIVKKTITVKLKAKEKASQKLKKKFANKNKKALNLIKKCLNEDDLRQQGRATTKNNRKNNKIKKTIMDDSPPVLEPMLNNLTDEKINSKKNKVIPILKKQVPRNRNKKMVKDEEANEETIEDVMKDLTFLIKNKKEEKKEIKTKKLTKKQMLDIIKNLKKENFDYVLNKYDIDERKIIDILNLDVANKKILTPKRRNSIETSHLLIEPNDEETENLYLRKLKNSTDSVDFPEKILRNGKQRKLKEDNPDLDVIKNKKRRLMSDYESDEGSVSEMDKNNEFIDKNWNLTNNDDGNVDESETMIRNMDNCDKLPNKDELLDIMKKNFNEVTRNKSESVEINSVAVDNEKILACEKVENNDEVLNEQKEDFNEENDAAVAESHLKAESIVEEKCETEENPPMSPILNSFNNANIKTEQVEEDKKVATEEENLGNLNDTKETSSTNKKFDVIKINKNGVNNNHSPENCDEKETEVGDGEEKEKESILQALGLQRLKWGIDEIKKNQTMTRNKTKNNETYTGTLKAVIKLNHRDKKKSNRSGMKMLLQKKDCNNATQNSEDGSSKTAIKENVYSSDTAGAHRKSHYSNRSNIIIMDGSSEHTSDGELATQDGAGAAIKALVIPEKASSFSIHPGRLCKDECSYCFGKFGLFDTPCHIAQMKSVERQDKILEAEKHLTRDSCLCDACYRHVDRKSNIPSYINKSLKRNNSTVVAPGPRQNHCHVLGCNNVSSNILRRKWIIKMRKSICQVINIDLDNPGLHSIPICDEHYTALEHLMVCAMCKRRLARNHVHYLNTEVQDLNEAFKNENVPLILSDKPVVCKLCKCFASILLKLPRDRPENSLSFFEEYKKRLLHFNDIVPMDLNEAEQPIVVPTRNDNSNPDENYNDNNHQKKKKKNLEKYHGEESSSDCLDNKINNNNNNNSRSESPNDELFNDVDYNTLIPAINMECDSDNDRKESNVPHVSINRINKSEELSESIDIAKVLQTQQRAKGDPKSSDLAVKKLGSNPSISVRQLFPGEEDLPLNVQIDFNNSIDRTPEGWEKCTSVIQYDTETKRLWQELQKPYGNQSSFLRHLILLEKYFRNGDLVLSNRAGHHSLNYTESVQHRLRAYDNIPTPKRSSAPSALYKINTSRTSSGSVNISNAEQQQMTTSAPTATLKSLQLLNNSVTITSQPSSKAIISQLNSNSTSLSTSSSCSTSTSSSKSKLSTPPGLISLRTNSLRPVAPVNNKLLLSSSSPPPQPQKIKFPITKNWRPNLIPIDPNKKQERKMGLVQVISGGKPYHITLEDYKKMCAIKRSFEMKQKRQQEFDNKSQRSLLIANHNSSSILKPKSAGPKFIKSEPLIDAGGAATTDCSDGETILEKLDRQIEKLEAKINENSTNSTSLMLLPKIPKSLTVIPQTVTVKKSPTSRPSSPILQVAKS